MDVTCNRCSTTYEFEEALISTTGTTVKCMQCGHLFKVRRRTLDPARRVPDSDPARELRWRVRRLDGSTHLLESLGDLSQLIAAGQFGRDDEVSRTGQVWRKLGDIQELASVFDGAVRPRRSSVELSQPPMRVSEQPAPPPPPPPPPPPLQPGATLAASASAPAPPPEAPRASRRAPAPSERPHAKTNDIVATPAPPESALPEAAKPAGEDADRATDPEHDTTTEIETSSLDDDAAPPSRQRRPGPFVVAILSLLIAAGGAVLLLRPQPAPSVKPEDHPAREFLERGDQALAAHLPERFRDAIAAYEKALAFYPDDAHILSSISRAYAVWAALLRFRIAAQREADAVGPAALAAMQAETKQLTEFAKQYAERAAQRNPGNEEASVVLSDALRLSGNLVAARAELDRARATEGVAKAETLRVAALLAVDEAGGDYHAGRELAEQAVAREPTLLRARLLLARCLADDADFEGARMHLDAAGPGSATHPIVEEARAEIARLEQQARKPAPEPPRAKATGSSAGKPDAGPDPAATKPPRSTAPVVSAPARPPAPSSGAATNSGKGRDDADDDPGELTKRGEAALEQGAVPAAQRLFERALALEPGMPRARTGLGYVALERGQPRLAVNHFRPAARGGNPEALIGLGDAYRRLNRGRDALAVYREYLKHHPRGEHSSIAQRQVELLGEQLKGD